MKMIVEMVEQVKVMNAGEMHVKMENIENKKGVTAVISVYDNQKPSNVVLDELYEWAEQNNEEVKLKIEELQDDMSWNSTKV